MVGSPGGWLQPRRLVSGSLGPLRNLVIWSRSVQNMFFEYSPDSFRVLPLAPKWGAPFLSDLASQTDRQASRNKYKMAAGGENWPSLNSVVWAKIRVKQLFRGGDVNCSAFELFYSALKNLPCCNEASIFSLKMGDVWSIVICNNNKNSGISLVASSHSARVWWRRLDEKQRLQMRFPPG